MSWLIKSEKNATIGYHVYLGTDPITSPRFKWVKDLAKGLHFCCKDDANKILEIFELKDCTLVECE